MDETVSVINELIDGKINYKKIIDNKDAIIDNLKNYSFQKIDLKDIDLLSNKIFSDCLLASIVGYKELFHFSLYPYKITSQSKIDKIFGDLTTEVYPNFIYLLFDGDYDAIEEILVNKSRHIHKAALFDVYVKLCLENNNVKRLENFIKKNIDKSLFKTFEESVLSAIAKYNVPEAFNYLNYCEENCIIDNRMYGMPYEIRNMLLSNIPVSNYYPYSVDSLLATLKNLFNYKIINYEFAHLENDDDELNYYKKLEKFEEELLKIVRRNLGKEFDCLLKDIQSNITVMSFFYRSPDLLKDLSLLEQLLAIKKSIEIHLSYHFFETKFEDYFIYLCSEFSDYIESFYKDLNITQEEEEAFDKNNNHLFKSKDFKEVVSEYDY